MYKPAHSINMNICTIQGVLIVGLRRREDDIVAAKRPMTARSAVEKISAPRPKHLAAENE
jgi:hypothetical protein